MRITLLLLLAQGCDASFRVVPQGGSILLSVSDDDVAPCDPVIVTVCGFDADGIAVTDGTAIWLDAQTGVFSPQIGVDMDCLEDNLGSVRVLTAPAVDDSTPSGQVGQLGCAQATYLAPDSPGTAALTARSGSITADDREVKRTDQPSMATAWATPTELGPEGGTVVVGVRVLGLQTTALEGARVHVTSDVASPTASTVATTSTDGLAQVTFTTTSSATLNVLVDGLEVVMPSTLTIDVQPPSIDQLAPESCYWVDDGVLEINGSGFAAASIVTVDGRVASVTDRTANRLVVDLPRPIQDAPIDVDVRVENPNGTDATATFAFEVEPADPSTHPSACAPGGAS